MAFIEVNNLKYRYPHTENLALDGISFQIEKGQFIGIAGQNKSGKSTLCQAFSGLIPTMFKGAYGGKIVIDGMEAAKTPVAELCQKVGLVFQNPFNQLSGAKDTVFEEIAFGLQNLGVPRDEIVKRVEENLRLLDIEEYRDRNPFDLSGGQTQRVAIASILAMNPQVIVLDEPTSQLDPQGSEEVFRVVEKLSEMGITIIMVEHKVEKLAAYCHKILLLHEGKQIAYDTPEQIFSRDDLEELGVEAPVFTRVCRTLSVKEGDNYPVTLDQTEALKWQFPEGLPGRQAGDGSQGQQVQQGQQGEGADKHAGSSVFTIENLNFSYTPEVTVIDQLNLKLDYRPTAIIGQNGAGKTTLVKLLKGLLKPVSGSILFGELDISGKTVAQLAGSIGYVFQNPDDQIFKNQVLEEVMVGPLNIGMNREEAKEHARNALTMVDLLQEEKENPYDLDLSERKLVAIASVVAMNPDVLILDEPTIAQDSRGRAIIGKLVQELSSQGKLIVAILHDMDFVAEYFQRVIVMAHGRILADGPGAEVFYETEALKEARLEQPHVTALCQALGYKGAFLTIDDMRL